MEGARLPTFWWRQGSAGIFQRWMDEFAPTERVERRRECGVFLALAFALAPILAVLVVAGFGFAVWIWQMIAGPPGPPPP